MRKTGKVIAIIQARLGSTRLPMKSLLCLRDVPVIDWVTRRLGQAARLDGIMVAVPDTPLDRALLDHLQRHGIPCVAGSEDDVLARFCLAARKADAGRVVRVCADNPLIWGGAIDRLVDFYDQGNWDYAYNHIPRNNLWPSQREHCLNYIWDNAASFRIGTFDPEEDWLRRPDLKLDMDKPDEFCRLALKPITPEMDARDIVRVFG